MKKRDWLVALTLALCVVGLAACGGGDSGSDGRGESAEREEEAGLEFAGEVLRPGGAYVAKVLAGGADNNLVAELKRRFTTVKHAKPPASRKGSSEWYVVAQGFKG